MKMYYENYDPSKDTEHLEIWGGRTPGNRDELIQWAGELANKTGKRVRINAMDIVPSPPPKPVDIINVAGSVIGVVFVLILILGLVITLAAILTGNFPY